MKKIMFMAIVAGTFAFTSCSKDDDGGEDSSCETCSISMMGMEISNEFCDNGDGTYTMTSSEGGEPIIQELPEGMSFNDIIEAQEQGGMTCN